VGSWMPDVRGLLDGYHAVVTSSFLAGRTPSAPSALISWSGATSPIFLSLLMFASLLSWKTDVERPTGIKLREFVVYSLVGTWTFVSFCFFALVRLSPEPYHSNHIVQGLQLLDEANEPKTEARKAHLGRENCD
jgi:hypothetical protein